MIHPDIIQVTAIITVILCFFTAWVWRGRFVAVNWVFFIAMGIGSGIRGWFYYSIDLALIHGRDVTILVPLSRFIAEFVLIATSLMAIGALVYYYANLRLDE